MQLFITDFKIIKNNQIQIDNEKNIHQISNVLRLRHWDIFYVQNNDQDKSTRHQVEIIDINKKSLTWNVIGTEHQEIASSLHSSQWRKGQVWMLIAMPNKREKVELISQKLSEIWINEIIFWTAERSVIKEFNEKKLERLNLIIKEAVEQSRWRYLPEVKFVKNIENIAKSGQVIVFDKEMEEWRNGGMEKLNEKIIPQYINSFHPVGTIPQGKYWVVGPEWWLTKRDYEQFNWNYTVKNLWSTALRMETASIIWAWLLKSHGFIQI